MAKTKNRKPRIDTVLSRAVEQAREALSPIAKPSEIGDHQGVYAEGERLVTHLFSCLKPGYQDWNWVATLTRVPRARQVTVCEIDLLPGENALLAPPWIPWAQRLLPEDIGREDVLPYVPDDPRLDQSFEDSLPDEMDERIHEEIGLGRPRVLSEKGRREAAERWYNSEQGPARKSGYRTKIPPHTCSDCGFMVKMAGSMRRAFGVCANEWSPDDGRVVSLDHSCGAHSETDIKIEGNQWGSPPHRMDETDLETLNLQAE